MFELLSNLELAQQGKGMFWLIVVKKNLETE